MPRSAGVYCARELRDRPCRDWPGSDANACKYCKNSRLVAGTWLTCVCRRIRDVRHLHLHSPEERTYVFFNLMQTTANFRVPAHGFYLIVTHLTDGRASSR